MIKRFLTLLTALFLIVGTSTTSFAEENPCGMMKDPCNTFGQKSIRSEKAKDMKKLIADGKALWHDTKLGKTGNSCIDCHNEGALLNIEKHAGKFPHYVEMPDDIITFDQMVNYCMLNPMQSEPIAPNSLTMTAIAAYYNELVRINK